MSERICIYPGSFDPVTVGHLDVIRRCAALFDRVIVAVLHNPAKQGEFPVEERVALLRKVLSDMPQVTIDTWDGLLADYVMKTGAAAVIRGLRDTGDYTSESRMALINRQLGGVETVMLQAEPAHQTVSSSLVRQLAAFGGNYDFLLPECIQADVRAHYKKNSK